MRVSWRRCCAVIAVIVALCPEAPAQTQAQNTKGRAPRTAEDLMVVDCLLPGKIRRLGRRATFLTPRRPIRTTALDCGIRGGEFTAYDRADYRTALSAWLGEAKAGSAEAQYYVGEIYERGLGTDPDYASAASWYEKAAEQGHSAAMVNLGHLYEAGLGKERDPEQALHWYRRASGLAEDMVVLEPAEYQDLVSLAQALAERQEQVESLRRELEELRRKEGATAEGYASLERRILEQEAEIGRLSREREARREEAPDVADGAMAIARGRGRHVALVIGNARYQRLDGSATATANASAVAAILRQRYGFTVRELHDASRFEILTALNDLRSEVTEQDSVLIYYAGRGRRDVQRQRGWWLPVDAESDNRANWLSNQVLSEHVELIAARHVLVIADSCFEGALTRSSIPYLPKTMTPSQQVEAFRKMQEKKARLVMSSALEQPEEESKLEHARFTSVLLDVLRESSGVLQASALYARVASRMADLDADRRSTPPTLMPIRWASHEGGDFLFVPVPSAG